MSEDEDPMQMPAARLDDYDVDGIKVGSARRRRWERHRESAGDLGRGIRWLLSPFIWLGANAKDILVALAAVASLVLIADRIELGGFSLSDVPSWVGDTATAIDEQS